MIHRNVLIIASLVQLAAALPFRGIYLFWLLTVKMGFEGVGLITLVFMVEGVLFLLFPIASFIGSLLNRQWPFYTLAMFPFLAFIHGVSAVPYLAKPFPIGVPSTIALVIINLGFVLALVFYKVKGRVHA